FVKSSYSTQAGECLEVALNIPRTVAVQDSKSPGGPTLRLTPATWVAFTTGLGRAARASQ
ncbi:DUF397 domain-containing protein, partial [Streptomyces sp. NPDC048416]|uniref:DUF397 domain-containing protein n=1 Tax=Streptomyces sp. NPDC048416 TaxID=3365546 RepID=UPI0037143630